MLAGPSETFLPPNLLFPKEIESCWKSFKTFKREEISMRLGSGTCHLDIYQILALNLGNARNCRFKAAKKTIPAAGYVTRCVG